MLGATPDEDEEADSLKASGAGALVAGVVEAAAAVTGVPLANDKNTGPSSV